MASIVAGLTSALTGPLGWILGLFGVGFMFQALSNVIGSATGQNPSTQAVSAMMETLVPLMVTMMPMMMVMNIMMGIFNVLTRPFAQLAQYAAAPTYAYLV